MRGWFHALGGGVDLIWGSMARLASAAVVCDVEEMMAVDSDSVAGSDVSACFCLSAPEETFPVSSDRTFTSSSVNF